MAYNINTTVKKGGLGLLTFLVAYIASHPNIILKLLPSDITTMTVGSLISALIVALTNWLKNRNLK